MHRHWRPRGNSHGPHIPGYNMGHRQQFQPNMPLYDGNLCHYRPHMPHPPPWFSQQPQMEYVRHARFRSPTANHANVPGNFKSQDQHAGRGSKRNMPNTQSGPNKKKTKQNNKKERDAASCPFYCKSCEKGYMTEENYSEHCSTHMECPGEGCCYVAAAKLVKLHYEMQHKSGLAKKIWNLESKEDIEKWRAERKRNFPTKENIERKRQERAEKRTRGEVIGTKQFGKMKGQNNKNRENSVVHEPSDDLEDDCHGNKKKKKRRHRRNNNTKQRPRKQDETDATNDADTKTSEHREKVIDPTLDPLAYVIADDKDLSDTESDPNEARNTQNIKNDIPIEHNSTKEGDAILQDEKPGQDTGSNVVGDMGALHALASLYGDMSSDDEEEDGDKQTGPFKQDQGSSDSKGRAYVPDRSQGHQSHQLNTLSTSQSTTQPIIHSTSQSMNCSSSELLSPSVEDRQIYSEVTKTVSVKDTKAVNVENTKTRNVEKTKSESGQSRGGKRLKAGGKGGGKKNPAVPQKRLTLLQRLLAPDIRHERNVVLQCIRHIVNNDFFGVSLVEKQGAQIKQEPGAEGDTGDCVEGTV